MASYDELQGFNSLADFDISQILAGSYISFLDWALLNKGGFTNVKLNDSNINGFNRSQLRLAKDNDYTNGRVWETFRGNLVWESGLTTNIQPINISGVYVNNTFYPSNTSGAFKHHIEYTTGRVVFDSGIATNSQVKLEYSYKNITVVEAKDYPALRTIEFRSFNPMDDNFTQTSSGDYATSPNVRNPLPLIGVEVTPRIETQPYEIGNKVKWVNAEVIYHVLGETDSDVKSLTSRLVMQKEATNYLLDMTMMARSGAFPLNSLGAKNSNPLTYPNLVKENAYRYCESYIDKCVANNGSWLTPNLYHGSVNNTMKMRL